MAAKATTPLLAQPAVGVQPVGAYPPVATAVAVSAIPMQRSLHDLLGHSSEMYIKQHVELLEAFTGCQTMNSYDIFGGELAMPVPAISVVCPQGAGPGTQLSIMAGGQQIMVEVPAGVAPGMSFTVQPPGPVPGPDGSMPVNVVQIAHAAEHSECLMRQFCGPRRSFQMAIGPGVHPQGRGGGMRGLEYSGGGGMSSGDGPIDLRGAVMLLERPFKCCTTPFCCMLQELHISEVVSGSVRPLGAILEQFTCFKTYLHVVEPGGQLLYNLVGPCIKCDNMCCDVDFKIVNPHGMEVGQMKKKKGHWLKEMVTTADNFTISFPGGAGLATEHKALLLGAVFLIDFMFFENNPRQEKHNGLLGMSAGPLMG